MEPQSEDRTDPRPSDLTDLSHRQETHLEDTSEGSPFEAHYHDPFVESGSPFYDHGDDYGYSPNLDPNEPNWDELSPKRRLYALWEYLGKLSTIQRPKALKRLRDVLNLTDDQEMVVGSLVRYVDLKGGLDVYELLRVLKTLGQLGATDPAGDGLDFLLASEVKDTELSWVIRGLLAEHGFMVLGGAEKSYKTWLLLAMAVAVATGGEMWGHPKFKAQQGRVVVLTGEGGRALTVRRLRHLVLSFGADPDEVLRQIHVSDSLAPMGSAGFERDMTEVIEREDPLLVVVDPAYVYVGEGREAGNVFDMGRALRLLHAACGGRATVVGHHFTKAGRDNLELGSLTQAGFREAADHWLLVYRVKGGLDSELAPWDQTEQKDEAWLEAKWGTRHGLGWPLGLHLDLGLVDLDTLRYSGDPKLELMTLAELKKATKGDEEDTPRKQILRVVRDLKEPKTKTEILGLVKGKGTGKSDVFDDLVKDLLLRPVETKRPNSRGQLRNVTVFELSDLAEHELREVEYDDDDF